MQLQSARAVSARKAPTTNTIAQQAIRIVMEKC
jgi:hypothetical protein